LVLVIFAVATFASSGKDTGVQKDTGKEITSREYQVTGVNDFDLRFANNDPAGMIVFKSDAIEQCTLAFVKSRFIQGRTTRAVKSGEGDVGLDCLNQDDVFGLDYSGTTYVKMTVKELGDKAVIALSFSLRGANSQTVLSKDNVTLVVSRDQLKTMRIK